MFLYHPREREGRKNCHSCLSGGITRRGAQNLYGTIAENMVKVLLGQSGYDVKELQQEVWLGDVMGSNNSEARSHNSL